MPQHRLVLTIEERHEKHRVLLRDTLALTALSGLVLVFSFVTFLLFHSFTTHRLMLEQRWRARGEAALAAGKPVLALASLHSALAYAPEDRGLQVELAMALAAAGHTQEAQTYFNTLLEAEPGSGLINLQLARLAVRQNNVQAAVDSFQAAIDGTWNGDAYTRRREIRLELSKYLIAQNRLPEARNQLLIAAGNAPQDAELQMQVGQLLIEAQDSGDAMDVFHRAAQVKGSRLEGLEAEARTAMTLGRYQAAHTFLTRALTEPEFARQSDAEKKTLRDALSLATTVLALYPEDTLSPGERARRIAYDATLAQKRLAGCQAASPSAAAATFIPSAAGAPSSGGMHPPAASPAGGPTTAAHTPLLSGLAAHLRTLNPLGNTPPSATPIPLPAQPNPANAPPAVLAAQWTAIPTGATLNQQLMQNPDFAASTMQLIYATARATTGCGPLTGEDQALARMALDPGQVEAQP